MTNTSPFGKYSQLVAVFTAIAVVMAHLGSLLLLGQSQIETAFWIALGAVFGASASTAATNGAIGRDVKALHKRLDAGGVPPDGAGDQ